MLPARGAARLLTRSTGQSSTSNLTRLPCLTPLRPSTRQGLSVSSTRTRHEARQLSFVTAVNNSVQITQDALISLHSTIGLPWWLAIPAAALGITLTIRLPLQIYSRKIILGQRKLLPFITAWRTRHATVHKGLYAKLQEGKTRRRIYQERGVQSWKIWVTLFSIPPWLLIPEAIRRLSGARGGILALATGRYKDEQAEVADVSPLDPAMGGAIDTSSTGALETAQSALSQFEPSMTTGGLFWFPDLTAPDPYGLLSIALAGLLCWTWIPKTAAGRAIMFNLSSSGASSALEASTWMWRLRRSAFVASLLLPMAAINLPAGMFVYWVSSAAFGHLNTALVEYAMPLDKKPAQPPQANAPEKAQVSQEPSK